MRKTEDFGNIFFSGTQGKRQSPCLNDKQSYHPKQSSKNILQYSNLDSFSSSTELSKKVMIE